MKITERPTNFQIFKVHKSPKLYQMSLCSLKNEDFGWSQKSIGNKDGSFVNHGFWQSSCRINDRLVYLIGGADDPLEFLAYPKKEPPISASLVGLGDCHSFVFDSFKMKDHRMYPACVYHNASKTVYVLGGLKKNGSENHWLPSASKFSIAKKDSYKDLTDMESPLMGISAVIPEPNKVPAVIYLAGLSDDSHVKVIKLEDSDKGSTWSVIGTYYYDYMFSSLIPLRKAPQDHF